MASRAPGGLRRRLRHSDGDVEDCEEDQVREAVREFVEQRGGGGGGGGTALAPLAVAGTVAFCCIPLATLVAVSLVQERGCASIFEQRRNVLGAVLRAAALLQRAGPPRPEVPGEAPRIQPVPARGRGAGPFSC